MPHKNKALSYSLTPLYNTTVQILLSVLIFLPLLLVSAIVGEFFKQLATVLVITYILSQIVAIFLTPIIAYIVLALRAKPILMTMVSNALALLPIALAIGTDTQIIQDLAIAIMGGLLFAIVINLFIVPLFFYFVGGEE